MEIRVTGLLFATLFLLRKPLKLTIALILLSMPFSCAQPSGGNPPKITDSLAVVKWLKEKHIPGLAVSYVENGRIKNINLFGEARPGIPVTENTVFNVASITKTVTTMVTLSLVNAGRWQLDEPLAPHFTDPDVAKDPRSQRLTTRDILTHRAGFPNWRSELPDGKLAFQFDPGTKYQYSGEGMEYLRRALESKFNQPLDRLADSLIFKPLGMTDTRFTWNAADDGRFAYPFDAAGNPLEIVKNTIPNAADLLKTTLRDYAKFVVWMLNGAGLKKDLFDDMVAHQVERKANSFMGLGWVIYDPAGNLEYALSHGGHDPGVHTIAILLPRSKKGLVIFTNSDNGIQLYPDLLNHYLGTAGQAIVTIETGKKP